MGCYSAPHTKVQPIPGIIYSSQGRRLYRISAKLRPNGYLS